MGGAIVVAVVVPGSIVDGCGFINGCPRVAAAKTAARSEVTIILAAVGVAVVAIPTIIIPELTISVVVPFMIAALVARLVPHSFALVNVRPVLSRHCWHASTNKRCDDGDPYVVSNAFHKHLRI
jgi:hypothetical protein